MILEREKRTFYMWAVAIFYIWAVGIELALLGPGRGGEALLV
jgi:hypothetical protein